MTKGIYITSAAPQSGKTVIALGLMDYLAGRCRVGFFRPIVKEGETDALLGLMASRYQLPFPVADMAGCSYETARLLMAAGRSEDLYGQVLDRYMRLADQCDFVVCAGTDYRDASAVFELEFNMEMANHLGLPAVAVIKGCERPLADTLEATQVLVNTLRDHHCEVLAVVVNRAEPEALQSLEKELSRALPGDYPCYVVPEDPRLERPTVREIAGAIQAEIVSGSDELLAGGVTGIKVAAMELPHFLDHLEDGSLVIVPGDRSDIILGALAAGLSGRYPHIAGLVLTGDLQPAPQIQGMLAGLGITSIPILSVPSDTFTTAIQVHAVESRIGAEDRRKIAAALGLVEAHMRIPELTERVSLDKSERVTPLMFQYDLMQRAKRQKRHIVLPEGTDERVLRAAEMAVLREICHITLLGEVDDVRRKIASLGLNLGEVPIIDPLQSEQRAPFAEQYFQLRQHKGITREMAHDLLGDPNYFGTMMAYLGQADGMVSGATHTTAATIRPALEFVKTLPGISIVSSVFFMCLDDRVLVYGDCAINPDPTAEQLADIAISSAQTAEAFGIAPRVAMLSYSTGESGQGPDVDKVRAATALVRQRRPDLLVEGPLQYDAAIDADVAKLKAPGSLVAGRANVFIFPDLSAGNNAYKAVQRAADAIAIGPVLQGLKKPINDLSRGALVPDIVNTIAITAIQAQMG
ncbi:phosphate acetyltransferase [Methyloterricola oryzae]|uniref:phosphate acetyltransferase n=1 Tax=Methyloterricola oryzae TaxID=1495050 RepID=UPI0005EB27DB|nr:phosphate acetyltransferase [Methyloterricola oryzae]